MPIPATSTAAAPPSVDSEEARFKARMARVGGEDPSRRSRREGEDEEKDEGFRLGWFGWLVVDALIVVGTVVAVLSWPPVEACRVQEKTVGFYAGETVGKCIRRGIGERLTNAEQHLKMILRGSGH
jgi:hypothetical protein